MLKPMMAALMVLALASPAGAATKPTHNPFYRPTERLIYKLLAPSQGHTKAATKARYYAPIIRRQSRAHGLPPKRVAALIYTESTFRPRVSGPPIDRVGRRALGLMQVVPFKGRFRPGENPWDPETNIRVGCRLLKQELVRFKGDWECALTAYNCGPAPVSRGLRTSHYARWILRAADAPS